jgi:hypothetical protein
MRSQVLTVVALAAGVAAPSASAAPSLHHQLQNAYTEFRSGLRHEDGDLTCGRMTLQYRRQILGAVADEGVAGLGCVAFVQEYGRELYNELDPRNARLGQVKHASATRARALQRLGGSICFARVDGRWRIARADEQRVRDCHS